MSRIAKVTVLSCGLALATLAAYANDFENGFHFDDFHAVSNNLFIRDLHNIPRFFADAVYFSTLPDHRMYRPVVSSSLALDYRLGGGLKPFWFQLSTFTWYVVQVILVCFLFRHIMDSASPHRYNLRAALCYGLHPVNAETVNYVIQRNPRGKAACQNGVCLRAFTGRMGGFACARQIR